MIGIFLKICIRYLEQMQNMRQWHNIAHPPPEGKYPTEPEKKHIAEKDGRWSSLLLSSCANVLSR